jgi:hypothetical protein
MAGIGGLFSTAATATARTPRKSPKVAHASDAKSARTKTVEKFIAHTFPAIHWQFLCTRGVYLHVKRGLPEGRAWRAVFARAAACLRSLFSVSEGGVFTELNGQPASSAAPCSAYTGSGMGKYLQPRSQVRLHGGGTSGVSLKDAASADAACKHAQRAVDTLAARKN